MKRYCHTVLVILSLVITSPFASAQDDGKDIDTKGSSYSHARDYPINEGWVPTDVSKPYYYNLVLLSLIFFLSIPIVLFVVVNLIKRSPKYSSEECPRCKSIKLERMPKTIWDKLFSILLVKSRLKRYECLNCKWEGIKITD